MDTRQPQQASRAQGGVGGYIFAVLVGSLLLCSSQRVVGAAEFVQQDKPLVAIQPAPEFSLTNVLGGEVTSQDLKGKVVVVEFWATWAKPTHTVIPDYNRLRRELKDRGVEIIGVTFESGTSVEVATLLNRLQMEYPVVMGTPVVDQGFGGTPGYPTTFLVGKDWKVYRRILGNAPNKIANLERDILALLAMPTN